MADKIKVDLKNYKYEHMYNRFIKESQPWVCVTGGFDITNLYKQKEGHKLNAMLCFCVLQAAQDVDEFHYSIKEDGLYYYKNVKTNAVIEGGDGNLYYADYKYYKSYKNFEKEYRRVNDYCTNNNCSYSKDTGCLIATSAMINYSFTSINLALSDSFIDSFLMWGKYEKDGDKIKLNISLRFHHAIIDGQRAGLFFNKLQEKFNNFKV